MADAYACQVAVPNEVRPQGNCSAGFVQVNPTVVVFSADVPDAAALTGVFLLGFCMAFGGPQLAAYIVRAFVRLIHSA